MDFYSDFGSGLCLGFDSDYLSEAHRKEYSKDRKLDSCSVPHLDYWNVALPMGSMTMELMWVFLLVWQTDQQKDIDSDSNLVILWDYLNEA